MIYSHYNHGRRNIIIIILYEIEMVSSTLIRFYYFPRDVRTDLVIQRRTILLYRVLYRVYNFCSFAKSFFCFFFVLGFPSSVNARTMYRVQARIFYSHYNI